MRGPRPNRTTLQRKLRREPTEAEKRLWYSLRAGQLDGYKFVRQIGIGPYIVDFACRDARLIVEVDGGQHADSKDDAERTAFLNELGYRVMRFWNNEVLSNTDGVLETVRAALLRDQPQDDRTNAPHPDPLPANAGRGR
jgi:very-short-patch-repair endonuclease